MATIHLKGKGLNDWIAYSMIQDKGPTAARRASCGPMLEAVRAIIAQRRAAVMEKLAATLTKEELALLTDLQTERDALAWALCEVLDGTKVHDLPAETGLGEYECARLYSIWQEAIPGWKANGFKEGGA